MNKNVTQKLSESNITGDVNLCIFLSLNPLLHRYKIKKIHAMTNALSSLPFVKH